MTRGSGHDFHQRKGIRLAIAVMRRSICSRAQDARANLCRLVPLPAGLGDVVRLSSERSSCAARLQSDGLCIHGSNVDAEGRNSGRQYAPRGGADDGGPVAHRSKGSRATSGRSILYQKPQNRSR